MKSLVKRNFIIAGLLFGLTGFTSTLTVARAAETIKTEVELSTKDVRSKETALGNVVADAIHSAAKVDAAIIAASSFSSKVITLPKGSFAPGDFMKTLEYTSDPIAIVKLTGAQVTKALEHGLYLYPSDNSGFLHFSGLQVTVNPNGDKEKKVVSIKINGSELSPSKIYRVAMPSPLAHGALAYFKIWKQSDIEKELDKTLEAAVSEYLTAHKTITKGDERLVIH